MEEARSFTLSFVKKEKVAEDAYSFYFDRSNIDLDFIAGQYIRMTLDIQNPDERGSSHYFTISSSPLNKEYLVVTTRIIQSTFKKTLFNLLPGQEVKFFGPMGEFILNQNSKREYVFLAGGIGITPFYSIITYVHQAKINTPITLFVSFTRIEDCIFYEELINISKENPLIKVIYTITHPEGSKISWNGETGRISEDLIKKYIPNVQSSIFYIAGPPKMVESMIKIVQAMGVSEENILKENFTGY